MVKIRLIFVKQFAFRRKVSHKQAFYRKEIDQKKIYQKKISTVLFLWNKTVQSSLKWLLGSSRRGKRLAWRSQGQLQTRLRFWSKLWIKKIHNALICGAFCDINKSLIKSVWNYTKRYLRPFVLILWTSFPSQVMKMLILLANSHSSFILVKWFLECQTNTLNCCFLLLTTLPASKRIGCDSKTTL